MQLESADTSIYAPIRYEATRPFALTLSKVFMESCRQGEDQRLACILGELFLSRRAAIAPLRRHRLGPVRAELRNVQTFAYFQEHSKYIVHASTVLIKKLLLSDVDISCAELTLPVESFYLHFGADAGLADNQMAIEGAFVTRHHARLQIDVVHAGFGQPNFQLLLVGEFMLGVTIDLADGTKVISQAVHDSVHKAWRQHGKLLVEMAQIERLFTLKLIRPATTVRSAEIIRFPLPVDRSSGSQCLLEQSLYLIVKILCYLKAHPEDSIVDWGEGTPDYAIAAIDSAHTPETKGQIEGILCNAGYVKVHHVGRSFAQPIQTEQATETAY